MTVIGEAQRTSGARARRIFLECTTTWAYGGNTGIQRVVRNFINHARSVGVALGIHCQPAVWKDSRWEFIADLYPEPAVGTEDEPLGSTLLKRARRVASVSPYPLRNLLFENRTKSLLRSAVFSVGDFLTVCRRRTRGSEFQFQPGDVLFLLDSTWHMPIWPGVSHARRQGARVGIMLYDLVPVLLPEMCVSELVASFENWIKHAVRHADFFVCISRAMAEESQRHLGLHFPDLQRGKVAFDSIRLGAALDLAASTAEIRPAVTKVFGTLDRPRPYLSVGTIEPRKNHWYLLDAFDLAWSRSAAVTLCIVGKKGWKCDHVLERIERHPQRGRRLFMFNDLSDGELKYCYRKACAAILPSLAEGFGCRWSRPSAWAAGCGQATSRFFARSAASTVCILICAHRNLWLNSLCEMKGGRWRGRSGLLPNSAGRTGRRAVASYS